MSGIDAQISLVRMTSRVSLVFGAWWLVGGILIASLLFTGMAFIVSNILLFSVSALGLFLGALIVLVGRACSIRWLWFAGIGYVIQYLVFIASVVLGVLPVGYYFSFYSLFPIQMIYYVLTIHNPIALGFTIPTLISIVPTCSLAFGVHFLKKKTDVSDLDAVVFLLVFGLFVGPLMSALAYILFGASLGKIGMEEIRSR